MVISDITQAQPGCGGRTAREYTRRATRRDQLSAEAEGEPMKLRAMVVEMLLVGGCAGKQSPAPEGAKEAPLDKPAFMTGCDVYAEAPVQIGYEDATGGAAVLYHTAGNIAKLRERTNEVAAFHNGSQGKTAYLHDLRAIPHTASVEEIEDGAKLTLVSTRPRSQDALRKHLQQEVWTMQKQGCGASHEAL
jgi:hypothetical protein